MQNSCECFGVCVCYNIHLLNFENGQERYKTYRVIQENRSVYDNIRSKFSLCTERILNGFRVSLDVKKRFEKKLKHETKYQVIVEGI